jgi:hypothetical protein
MYITGKVSNVDRHVDVKFEEVKFAVLGIEGIDATC